MQVSFEWGPTTAFGATTTSQTMTEAGAFSAKITGLTPGTNYHFRAKGGNDGGAVYGDDVAFNTLSYPDQPTNKSPANGATGTSLTTTLQASPFSDADGDTHAASRWQVRSSTGDYDTPVYDSGSTASLTGIDIPAGELNYSATYYWRVGYQDSQGAWSAYSKETSFTTTGEDYPDRPVNVSPVDGAIDVSLTSTLQGSAYADADGDAHMASRWQIRSTTGNYDSPLWDSGSSAAATSIAVPAGKLANSTTYYWRVGYQDSQGAWSAYSKETSFTTTGGTGAAPAVTTNAASSIGSTSATLNGNLTSMGTATTVAVSFEWGTTPGGPYSGLTESQSRTTVGSFSASLAGLLPGATYYYRAEAVGDSTSFGGERSFVTVSTPTPPFVTTDLPSSITSSSAILNGNLSSLGTAGTVQVAFEWGTTTSFGSTTPSLTRTSTGKFSIKLTGLTPDTSYYCRAKATGDGTAYGFNGSFATFMSGAPVIITTGATDIDQTTATLNGVLASMGSASSLNVSFEWGTAAEPYSHKSATQALTSIGAFSVGLSGLTPGTTYYYRAKVEGASGTAYGDEVSFFTSTVSPPTGSNYWAVIVGIANYQYLGRSTGDLKYPDDDAQALYDVLAPIWGEDHVKLLLNARGTKVGIQDAMSGWLDPLEDADDTVLFFYSGHGGYIDYDQAPMDEVDGRDEYLFPFDTYYEEDTILDDQLCTWLSSLESTRQVVVINSCFSGGFVQDLSKSGRVVLTGGDEDESTWETSALEHSVFPYYLLDGFGHLDVLDANSNNEISAEELLGYAGARTTEYEFTNHFDSLQHPQIFDGYGGELKLVPLATITIDTGPTPTSITLDGQAIPSSGKPVSVSFLPGSSHTFTFSVPALVESGERQPRYTFVSWSDNVSASTRTVTINQSVSFVANYRTEYYLSVVSDQGETSGSGWYDADSVATVGVDFSSGLLVRHVFAGWTGDSSAAEGGTVVMDSPKYLQARWKTDYAYLSLLIGGFLIVAILGAALLVHFGRRRRHKLPEDFFF